MARPKLDSHEKFLQSILLPPPESLDAERSTLFATSTRKSRYSQLTTRVIPWFIYLCHHYTSIVLGKVLGMSYWESRRFLWPGTTCFLFMILHRSILSPLPTAWTWASSTFFSSLLSLAHCASCPRIRFSYHNSARCRTQSHLIQTTRIHLLSLSQCTYPRLYRVLIR